jgi:hypothetical protein
VCVLYKSRLAVVVFLLRYVYNSADDDDTVTKRALAGKIFEDRDISRFLELSKQWPLLDIGANVGLVALQAALQGVCTVCVCVCVCVCVRVCV